MTRNKQETNKKIYIDSRLRGNDSGGFTLLELLVVIGIIAVLVSLAMVSYTSAQRKSRDSRRQADMKAIQGALEVYYSENSYIYPAVVGGSCASAVAHMKSSWPVDPVNSSPLIYTEDCDTSTVYCVCALLEVPGKGNASTTGCAWGGDKTYYCVGSLQ